MGEEASITHTLKFQARAIAADVGTDASSWLVGTNALRESNEIQLLEYDEDSEALRVAAVYPHRNEVWDVSPCPHDPSLLLTVGNAAGTYSATLWRRPDPSTAASSSNGASANLDECCQLQGHGAGPIHGTAWDPSAAGRAATFDDERLRLWAVREAGAECTSDARASDLQQLWTGGWDPHSGGNRLATAAGSDVQMWDTRSLAKAFEIEGAGHGPLRSLDWAPRSEHVLLTAGDDCVLRTWDLRMGGGAAPLCELGGHRHWVWSARFNPRHEQLVASASSDASAALWYVPRLLPPETPSAGGNASGIGGGNGNDGAGGAGGAGNGRAPPPLTGSRVESYEDREDSVYGVAWSAADPWLLASLSYDGRVVLNRVPSQLKYKIII